MLRRKEVIGTLCLLENSFSVMSPTILVAVSLDITTGLFSMSAPHACWGELGGISRRQIPLHVLGIATFKFGLGFVVVDLGDL